jgi:tRNA-2-methylthio-N6-dimethylallyladenosine synthase
MPKKLFIRTFGCQMNEYDSDKMADVLAPPKGRQDRQSRRRRHHPVQHLLGAREGAGEGVPRSRPGAHLKQLNPDLVIGVGGCVASQEGDAIVARAPYVDVVFGPQTLHRLPQLIAERKASGKAQVDISFPEIEKFDNDAAGRGRGRSAFVSIMEGCSKFCTFCIVPYTRGERSVAPVHDVLTEVADLAAQGVKEVTLLGQNVNAYRGDMDGSEEKADLALLIEYIAEMPGIERIRYTTSHPREMTQRLIDTYRPSPKLVSHLHLPVQSGSDRVLAAMKRGYTALEYKSIVRKLRAARPDIAVVRLHRRLPRRDRRGFREDHEADRRRRLRRLVLLRLQPAPGHAGAGTGRRHAGRSQAARLIPPAEAHRRTGAGRQPGDGRQRAARAGRRPVEEGRRTNSPAAPTTTASSISSATRG